MAAKKPDNTAYRVVNAGGVVLDRTSNSHMVAQAIQWLSNTAVMIGIPSDDEEKHDESGGEPGPNKRQPAPGTEGPAPEINNATLGYIHEMGSTINNMPPRPWLRPGVQLSRSDWIRYMKQAGEAAFRGEEGLMERALNAAGIKAVSATKNRISSGGVTPAVTSHWDPNHTTLIDTAQMLNSISYAIRRKRTIT